MIKKLKDLSYRIGYSEGYNDYNAGMMCVLNKLRFHHKIISIIFVNSYNSGYDNGLKKAGDEYMENMTKHNKKLLEIISRPIKSHKLPEEWGNVSSIKL